MADPIRRAYMIDPSRFERVARIDSTNSELMRRPFGARPAEPCALAAEVQEAGRGRNGRGWLGDASRSLALSVAIEREADGASLLGLPLAIGVAVADVLAGHGAPARLKWPNDLQVDAPDGPAKVGGILVEARHQGALQRVVAGVGLNLAPSPSLSAERVGQPAGALFADGAVPPREALERALADALADVLEAFPRDGVRPWLARWRALDALHGAPVDLLRGDGTREPGVARGVDDDGALRVERPDGTLERVVAGEVSVRRRG
jgi:BirA family biotin operon repressor/biotin-[acetyl-CoA-carboxylase] ligase